ncbi:MAG: type 4a pilus biogenesis protein PilO [Candidatus Omnitrophica bacterium]|nr:type 4a pilus biogenesis protein PilO [Candidatus Omnitrophota bacterium]
MKLQKTEKTLMFLYAVIVCGGGIYYALHHWAAASLRAGVEKQRNLRQTAYKIEAIVRESESVAARYAELTASSAGAEFSSGGTDILVDVKNKAAAAGLQVINVKPFDVLNQGAYAEFRFKVEMEGALQNLGNFLYHLDQSPYTMAVRFTQLHAQSSGEPLKIQLILNAILFK